MEIINQELSLPNDVFEEQTSLIKSHSEKMDVNHYITQRNAPPWKVRKDIILGKTGELFAAWYVYLAGLPMIYPDYEIYDKKSKSWDADLCYSKRNKILPDFGVKTCDDATYKFVGDYSWTFGIGNNNGCYGKDKLFSDPRRLMEKIVFVYVPDVNNNSAKIMLTADFIEIEQYLRPPKKIDKWGKKMCLYFNDVLKQETGD